MVNNCTFQLVIPQSKLTPRRGACSWGRKEKEITVTVNLRWLHLLALEDQLAQLEADSAVVDDKGNLA